MIPYINRGSLPFAAFSQSGQVLFPLIHPEEMRSENEG